MNLDAATITLIVTNVIFVLGGIGKFIWEIAKRRDDRLDREQDRLDRAQLAQLTLVQLEQVKKEGGERMKKIVSEVIKTRGVAITAFKEANGVNKKIADLRQDLAPSKPDGATDPARID
jgi:hypothetical protein